MQHFLKLLRTGDHPRQQLSKLDSLTLHLHNLPVRNARYKGTKNIKQIQCETLP
jgi:hypothetical protein